MQFVQPVWDRLAVESERQVERIIYRLLFFLLTDLRHERQTAGKMNSSTKTLLQELAGEKTSFKQEQAKTRTLLKELAGDHCEKYDGQEES